ncbi:MAG: hypothetical protein LIP23_07095 [Planctomycetes bacterium]|nr:hypothetical protein [Planctomycetota bacterium]
MTTTTKKKKKSTARVRPELIPKSCKYMIFDDIEYLMIPLADFDDWYESFENTAIGEYLENDKNKPNKRLLKARKKRLPQSGMKVFADRTWYMAVPVNDVQDWFEDIEDYAIVQYVRENPQPVLSWHDILQKYPQSSHPIHR